jgi:hypothetical protein
VYWSSEVTGLFPRDAAAVMFTVPPAAAGAVTVMDVADTVEIVAAADPKSTTVAPENPVPEMVTVVPPTVGPLLGLTCVMFTPLGTVVDVVVVVTGWVVVVVAGGVVVVVVGGLVVVVVVDPDPEPKSATSALKEFTLPAAIVLVSLWFGPMGVHALGQPDMEEEL